MERAQIAAFTAILRSRRWLSALLLAEADNNALAFAVAFRGLMESSAETTTALIGTPLTLAHHYPTIADGVSGLANSVVTSSELEDALIQYSHGRHIKKSEHANAPQSHWAQRVQEYLTVFEDLNASVAELYRHLCDRTHPGAPSVWMWLVPMDTEGSEFILSTEQDRTIVGSFLEPYETVVLDVLEFAFNAPVLVLKTFNYFPIKKLHMPELLNHDLNCIAAWAECRSELEGGEAVLQVFKQ